MTLNITDGTFSTTGATRNFRIGNSNFGFGAGGIVVTRSSDAVKFYNDIESSRSMNVYPSPYQNSDLNFDYSFLEGRTVISGSGTVDEAPFINSNGAAFERTGLYNSFRLECNASYYDSSNTLLHTYSGFVYGGIQVNGSTVTLRSITRNNVLVTSGSLDNGNINIVNNGSNIIALRLSSFDGAAAGSKTVWTYVGWELQSGYY